MTKIVNAMPDLAGMTKDEVDRFLESKLNVQLATVDEMGDPIIQPVWFHYDKDDGELYVGTNRMSKKVQNIRARPTVYFSIDDENMPYKGAKGKGTATIIEDSNQVVPIVEKMNIKYLGTQDHPVAKMLMENARSGAEILLKIKPRFFSTWDYGKAQ